MKWICLLVASVATFGCLPGVRGDIVGNDVVASTPAKSTYRIRATHVDLDTGNEFYLVGSGTGVSPYHILSCSHILIGKTQTPTGNTKLKSITAEKPETGFQWKLNLIYMNPDTYEKHSKESDISLLESATIGDTRFFDFVPLESEDNIPNFENETLGILGYHDGGDRLGVMPMKLIPNTYSRPTYTGYAQNTGGTSGGGVFTKEGKLAGVAWGNSEGVAHAVPLTSILQWTRVKQYQSTPYGGFQKQVYRDFSLLGRRKPVPVMQILPPPAAVPQQQQQQQQQAPPATNNKQTSVETKVDNSQCGSGGCSTGGMGMMMSRRGGGGMSGGSMMMAQQQQFQPQMRPRQQMAQQQYYDPNASPYAARPSRRQPAPSNTASVTPSVPNEQKVTNTQTTMTSKPCDCSKADLEKKLDELVCKCNESNGKVSKELQAQMDAIQAKLSEVTEATTKMTTVTRPVVQTEVKQCDCATENQGQFAAINSGLKSVEDRLNGLTETLAGLASRPYVDPKPEVSVPVSTGNQKPEPKPQVSEPQELIYLTAKGYPQCKETDALVERMKSAGVTIRTILLKPDQIKSIDDVPRLSVFNGAGNVKPDNYLGSEKITNFLASLK